MSDSDIAAPSSDARLFGATADQPMNDRILASRILIVDDTKFNRLMLKELVEAHGFNHIECAVDGQDALDKTWIFKPDLVLLDLMMPGVDGFDYCRELRQHHYFRHVPILVQTALSLPEQRNRVFELGASDMVIKPINTDELIARIHMHLERRYMLEDMALYNERLASEMQEARTMQNLLMPTAADLEQIGNRCGIRIAAHFEPSSELGGDFWAAHALSDHQLAFHICDFSGHGVSAALNTFRLQALIQGVLSLHGTDPGAFVTLLNRQLSPLLQRGQFATLFYGVIDTQRQLLEYTSAASPYPLIWKQSSQCSQVIDSSGVPVGVIPDATYHTQSMHFHPGDLLMLYSDALTETSTVESECISETMMCDRINITCADKSPGRAQSVLRKQLELFRAHSQRKLRDDLTINIYSWEV